LLVAGLVYKGHLGPLTVALLLLGVMWHNFIRCLPRRRYRKEIQGLQLHLRGWRKLMLLWLMWLLVLILLALLLA
jgi:phosphatidylglycerophosphate synthase